MSGRAGSQTIKTTALAFMLFGVLSFIAPIAAMAQFAQPLSYGNQNQTPQAEVPGSGDTPNPVTPGDTIGPPPVPSGSADTTTGNSFPNGVGRDRTVVYVMRQSNGGALGTNRGNRMAMTIRPDQLSSDQISQVQGVLGANLLSGDQVIQVNASDAQIEQLQQIMAAWPQYQMNGNKKKIMNDSPATGYPKANENSSYDFQGPLPTVRTFSRYLVILGVVCATVFMALAAYSMVLGHPYGGARVLGTAAGLMLLLMGYTIWKIVQMNTFKAMSNNPAISQNRPQTAQVNDANMTAPDLPIQPGTGVGGTGRSGIPVQPLGNANNP
ncbi:MAG TPA: hypothetical protein V6C76_08900 [Drouetiella sp.]